MCLDLRKKSVSLVELHGRLYKETLVSFEVMWSHKCCDNSEKKCSARWCLTSDAASWSSGNNRSLDWGSWLSRVIEESQGSFHLSRLIILSHSAASQLVICALKLPFSNYSSAFVFKRQTHLWFSIDVCVFLSLAEDKREKKHLFPPQNVCNF